MRTRIIRIAGLVAMVICLIAPATAMAQTPTPPAPHVDPSGLLPVYSGLALLHYYDNSLDYPLAKDAEGASQYLSKMPFANIPPDLDKPTADFADNGVKVSYSITDLFQLWDTQNALAAQSRLSEANAVFDKITAGLPEARLELSQLEIAAETTGDYLKVSSAAANSPLQTTYNEVLDKIRRLGEMLDLLTRPVVNQNLLTNLLNSANPAQVQELLNSASRDLINQTINSANPDILKATINALNPETLSQTIAASPDLLKSLLNSANPELLNQTINSANPNILGELINALNSGTLADLLAANPDLLKALLNSANPDLLSKTINSANPAIINQLLNALKSGTLGEFLAANPDLLKAWLNSANPDLLNQTINSANPAIINQLLNALKPGTLADLLAANPDVLKALLNSANPVLLNKTINSATPDILKELISALNPQALRDLLAANPDLLKALLNSANPDLINQLLGSISPGSLQKILNATVLTLSITPAEAYVGDEVAFEGTLTSQGKPLAGRQITLLLNSSNYLTATTDSQGRYQGKLKIPYLYVSKMEAQALYYPQDADGGRYLGASSQTIQLSILFYQAKISIQTEQPAYPGKNAAVKGAFDYGADPAPSNRTAQLYLDDALQSQLNASGTFSQTIALDPKLEPGTHQVVVSAAADGRYAPAIAIASFPVTRAIPLLDLNLSRISFVPGWTGLSGKLTSAAGPLNGAVIDFRSGQANLQLKSTADGSFDGKMNMGLDLGLLGSQTLTVRVQPTEPWNAPQDYSRSIFVVNLLGCALLLAAVVTLGIYLPRRLRIRFSPPSRKAVPAPESPLPAAIPLSAELQAKSSEFPVSSFQLRETSSEDPEETANPIIYTYRWVLKLVQALTRAILKPSQTLREYAAASSGFLGPLSKPFLELTLLVERRLYSRHQATPQEIEQGHEVGRLFKGQKKAE